MIWPNLSKTANVLTLLETTINNAINGCAKMFKDQTTGDFDGQVRYNSSAKRFEYWNAAGSAWVQLDVSGTSYFATATQGSKADAALPSSSYTAADVLAKLLTVDGAGSGLDADKFDGKDSSLYALLTDIPAAIPFRGCHVRGTVGVANNTNVQPTSISTEDYDTDSIHTINDYKLIVPSGVSKVKVGVKVNWNDATSTGIRNVVVGTSISTMGEFAVVQLQNTGAYNASVGGSIQSGESQVLPVSAGQYFYLQFFQTSGAAQNPQFRFWLEIIE